MAGINALMTELSKEKNLWRVYVSSLKIKLNYSYIYFSIFFSLVIAWSASTFSTTSKIADNLLAFSLLIFPNCISTLGFLLAGFSFFATVTDKTLFSKMAQKTHLETGLSYLKYNFYIFMRVFFEYLVFLIFTLITIVCASKDLGLRDFIKLYFLPPFELAIYSLSLFVGIYYGLSLYIILQLASFIYNVLAVVITNIKWEIKKEHELKVEENQSSNLSDYCYSFDTNQIK